MRKWKLFAVAVLLLPQPGGAITLGQLDDFQDGTVAGWATGAAAPDPVNVSSGGPGGAGDAFLQLSSSGGSGSGSRLVAFNGVQWTGDYTGAGLLAIELDALNSGPTDVVLRLAINGDGGAFSSATSFALPAGSGWESVRFEVTPGSWVSVGGTDVVATLGSVSVLRVLHAPDPAFGGAPPIEAILGMDDLLAVPEPGAAGLLAAGLLALGLARRRSARDEIRGARA